LRIKEQETRLTLQQQDDDDDDDDDDEVKKKFYIPETNESKFNK